MGKILQCSVWNHAQQHKLVSNDEAYEFQVLYHIKRCKGHYEVKNKAGVLEVHLCGKEHMQWRGEYPNGNSAEFIEIAPERFAYWLKRIESDKAIPEPRAQSDYSKKIAGEINAQAQYLAKIRAALKWHKGERVKG